jgi:hypothetical protein
MTRIITYSLRPNGRSSDDYYRAAASFADRWTAETTRDAAEAIAGFRNYRRTRGEPDRSDAEYAFELLVLGVMLRVHGGEAAHLSRWLAWSLKRLVRAQDRWPKWESAIKSLRGWIGWAARRLWTRPGVCENVDRLIEWLRANDANGQADRLAQWQEYLREIGPESARKVVARCLALADDFAETSEHVLGQYTAGVGQFLSESAPRYRHRYDAEFVSRSRLEYHLGMLGAEILSRAYRQRFLSAKRKVVIVPPCMRAQPEDKCKAIETPFGAKCQACTPTCRVHQITKLGEKRGFEVFIIPDELRVFGSGASGGKLGVVGVSCALTNWSGGWEADSIGVPAQGVLLDYVGCKFHWDKDGIPTDINLKKLEEVVGCKE